MMVFAVRLPPPPAPLLAAVALRASPRDQGYFLFFVLCTQIRYI